MGLKRFVISRLVQAVFTLWAFITVLFFLFRFLPGDPTSILVPQGLRPEARRKLIREFGLNEPLYVQYIKYMSNLLQGNLGESYLYQEPVWNILVVKFWNTIFLTFTALILAYTFGTILGALLAWKRGTKFEITGILYALMGRSMPVFWTGILLIIIFGFWLDVLPVAGMREVGNVSKSFWARYLAWDFVVHLILPLVTATFYFMSLPMLLMRNTMLDVLKADFIEMKEAEGLDSFVILYKHAARNSILPIVTMAAVVTGLALGGQVLIEVVFDWPGMGREMVRAVKENDYNVAMGAFFLMGTVVIIMNLVADILYGVLDPRVTYD